MKQSYLDTEADIAALASAKGQGALAVIRLAGPSIIERFASIFSRPKALQFLKGYEALHGIIRDRAGKPVDEVVVLLFRAPNSYTGQDGLDIMCHGGIAVQEAVLSTLLEAGFRQALPGEFSFRAFYNGKIDLARAEAVNELIAARTSAARADAYSRLSGALSKELAGLKESLLDAAATIALGMDYGEEEAAIVLDAELEAIKKTQAACIELAESYTVARMYKEGLMLALAGKTNAGKSSLFNRLLKEERAIVSPEPGTTRDYLEAELDIAGIPITVVDTAGVRDSQDLVEAEGVRRSVLLAESADILLYVVDATVGLADEDTDFLAAYPKAIKLWNKVDKVDALPVPAGWLEFSAKTGHGEASLIEAVKNAVFGAGHGEQFGAENVRIGSARHRAFLEKAADSLKSAIDLIEEGGPMDMAAVDLATAMEALGEITGEISSEDVLDKLFSSFCVGK